MSEHDNFSASWDKPVIDLSLIVTCKFCAEGRRLNHSSCQLHYRELVAAVKARETSKALSGSYERFQIQETEE